MERQLALNESEVEALFAQDPSEADKGGWQSLLDKLQNQFDEKSNTISLRPEDLERIPRYAFNYGNGGWEGLLKKIFERHLGPELNQ